MRLECGRLFAPTIVESRCKISLQGSTGGKEVPRIYEDLTQLIGGTPLVRLNRVTDGCSAQVLAKLEFLNPLSSIKDRTGLALINAAQAAGQLHDDTVLIEPTSGNTGIALAFIAAVKGLRLILIMPETMSEERRALLRGLGAELELTPAAGGMQAAVDRAYQLASELKNGLVLMQFSNPANPDVHERTTAQEIWDDTDGKVDAVVVGIGTGGSVSGIGRALKKRRSSIQIVGVEPTRSAVVSGRRAGMHNIQGIGAGFVPKNLDRSVLDECILVEDQEAFNCARKIARLEGIPAGISSGATAAAAIKIAQRPEMKDKTIVVIFASCAERYLSTPLYRDLVTT